MNAIVPFLSIHRSCDDAVRWVKQSLRRKGLRPLQTFDLHDARRAVADCPCPHHGTTHCDCQMIILLVYGETPQPAAIVLHGSDGESWLSLVNTPSQQADASLREAIEQALQDNPSKEGL